MRHSHLIADELEERVRVQADDVWTLARTIVREAEVHSSSQSFDNFFKNILSRLD